jgi:hypothetical protein
VGASEAQAGLLPAGDRSEPGLPAAQRGGELAAATGRGGVGQHDQRQRRQRRHERLRAEPHRQAVGLLAVHRQRRQRAGKRPAGVGRRGLDRGRRGGRLLHEQRREPLAEALERARRGGLLLRVALDRVGRQLVDVGEDRLGKRVQRGRWQAGTLAGGRQTAPSHPCADAIRREEGVQAATGAHLAAAEVHVGLPARGARRLRVLHRRDELAERLLHAGPQGAAEGTLQRAGVVRHALAHRGHDLVRERRELWPQRACNPGREGLPGPVRQRAVVLGLDTTPEAARHALGERVPRPCSPGLE